MMEGNLVGFMTVFLRLSEVLSDFYELKSNMPSVIHFEML